MLADMKVVKNKLICGSYEKQSVVVHAVNLDQVSPYYNPTNIPFSHNHSTRKSFNRGTPKMKLALKSHGNNNNNNNDHRSGSLTSGKVSSPQSSLSFEMIDESIEEVATTSNKNNSYAYDNLGRSRPQSYLNMLSLPNENFNQSEDEYQTPIPNDDGLYLDNSSNDLDYYPERMIEPEHEEFPVNSAQPPNYAPKLDLILNSHGQKSANKSKPLSTQRKTIQQSKSSLAQSKKFSNSNIDLHSIDDSIGSFGRKGTSSRNGSPTRNYTSFNNSNNNSKVRRSEIPKETVHARNNRKITVQIMAKPPPRSKTSLDLRANSAMSQNSLPMSNTSASLMNASMHSTQSKTFGHSNYNGHGAAGSMEENAEISVLTAYHERVHQQLSTRYATLQLVRNSTRYDVHGFKS